MKIWSRTGLPLRGIPPQKNDAGELLCPGSLLNFVKRPPHLLSDTVLIFWLRVRGIQLIFNDRNHVLRIIKRVRNLGEERPPLPMKLRQGGGGYVAFERLFPRDKSVQWKKGDDALNEI